MAHVYTGRFDDVNSSRDSRFFFTVPRTLSQKAFAQPFVPTSMAGIIGSYFSPSLPWTDRLRSRSEQKMEDKIYRVAVILPIAEPQIIMLQLTYRADGPTSASSK